MTELRRLEKYLAQLPRGTASYPECVLKGTVYLPFADTAQLDRLPTGALPADVAQIVQRRVKDSDWVPEVHMSVILMVYADHHDLDEAALQRWIYDCNEKALSGRLLRMVMALATPGMLMSGAARRWSQLHRGTTLDVGPLAEVNGRKETETVVRFPQDLYGLTLLHGLGGSIEIALQLSRAKSAKVELVEHDARSARYVCTWA